MSWSHVCKLEDVEPNLGVCAWVNARQIALFRLGERIFALDNYDPAAGANVISRGLTGDIDGELVVASPLYKHHYSLTSGSCLEDPAISVSVYPARVIGKRIWVNASVTGIELYESGRAPPHPFDDAAPAADMDDEALVGDEALVLRDPRNRIYRRIVLRGNRLRSAVLYGDARHGRWYFELIASGRNVAPVREQLLFGPIEELAIQAPRCG